MPKNVENYITTFSVKNLSLKRQNLFYKFLVKNLTVEEKETLEIIVIDPVGGKHDIFNITGVQYDGTKCEECRHIDCRQCGIYQRRMIIEEEKAKNESGA